jgi:dTDP-glucose 4,6-dehydratase
VEDHCAAIGAILKKGKVGETYFIGPDHPPITNLEVIKKVLAIMGFGEDRLEYVADRPGHDVRYALDWSKIRDELGWEPEVTLDRALQMTIAWYQENQGWWKHVKSGEYQKYYEKQYGGRK